MMADSVQVVCTQEGGYRLILIDWNEDGAPDVRTVDIQPSSAHVVPVVLFTDVHTVQALVERWNGR